MWLLRELTWRAKALTHSRYPININLHSPFFVLGMQPSGILLGPKVLANETIGVFTAEHLSTAGTFWDSLLPMMDSCSVTKYITFTHWSNFKSLRNLCAISQLHTAQEIWHSMKKFQVALRVPVLPGSRIFEASTGDEVMSMWLNQPFKTFDDLIVRKSKARQV